MSEKVAKAEEQQETQQAAKKEPDMVAIVDELKARYPDMPDASTLEQWKELFGKIFIVPLSEDELFIFRRITRLEYKNIQNEAQQAIKAGINIDDTWFEEKFVRTALLHPKWTVEFKNASPAGTIPTLYKQISSVSNFLSDQMAMQLILEV